MAALLEGLESEDEREKSYSSCSNSPAAAAAVIVGDASMLEAMEEEVREEDDMYICIYVYI